MYGYPISSSTATVISVALSAFVWPIYRIKSFVCSTLVEGYGGACPREQGAGGGRTLTPCCMTSWYRQNCLWHELTINLAGVLRFEACCFLPKCKGYNFFLLELFYDQHSTKCGSLCEYNSASYSVRSSSRLSKPRIRRRHGSHEYCGYYPLETRNEGNKLHSGTPVRSSIRMWRQGDLCIPIFPVVFILPRRKY